MRRSLALLSSSTSSLVVPTSMKAVVVEASGSMAIEAVPVPVPRPREVLIKVAAAGVNGPDVLQRRGLYPAPPGAEPGLGLEVSGTVVAMGDDASDPSNQPSWKVNVGDPVCALTNGSGYAEFVRVPVTQCLPVPRGMSMVQAAATPETFFTVFHNVIQRGQLKKDDVFFVHGGSSGIGTTAIQMARAFGASSIIATAGDISKLERLQEQLGVDVALNYKHDWAAELKATDTPPVDVMLDMVGARSFQSNMEVMGTEGRMVIIGFQGGSVAKDVDLMRIMLKRLTVTGSTLRSRTTEDKAKMAEELVASVWPMVEDGLLSPVMDKVLPWDAVNDAHAHLESRTHFGKTVLTL